MFVLKRDLQLTSVVYGDGREPCCDSLSVGAEVSHAPAVEGGATRWVELMLEAMRIALWKYHVYINMVAAISCLKLLFVFCIRVGSSFSCSRERCAEVRQMVMRKLVIIINTYCFVRWHDIPFRLALNRHVSHIYHVDGGMSLLFCWSNCHSTTHVYTWLYHSFINSSMLVYVCFFLIKLPRSMIVGSCFCTITCIISLYHTPSYTYALHLI